MPVDCSTIQNSQEGKQPKCMLIMIGYKTVVYIYNLILFSLKKESSTDTVYNADEPRKLPEESQIQKVTYCMSLFI